MSIEEALATAREFEKGAARLYREAAAAATEDVGRRVFGVLGDEESHHVAYLESRLTEWRREGKVQAAELATAVPGRAAIAAGLERVAAAAMGRPTGGELAMLERARVMEGEANRFYKRLVETLPPEGKRLFGRFLEIEDGHLALIEAEINFLTGKGLLFDIKGIK